MERRRAALHPQRGGSLFLESARPEREPGHASADRAGEADLSVGRQRRFALATGLEIPNGDTHQDRQPLERQMIGWGEGGKKSSSAIVLPDAGHGSS